MAQSLLSLLLLISIQLWAEGRSDDFCSDAMLPVIIAGAGPCGFLCAVVLQKYNILFVLVERVKESRLTNDVGSGFDMAPTAVRIFEHLELPRWRERMSRFASITMMTMDGRHVRVIPTVELPGAEACAVKRSTLQQCLVEKLGNGLIGGTSVRFGVSVAGYEEDGDRVTVRLSDGSALEGRALLACEGWRSVTRAQMLGANPADDPVLFCGIAMWWGKCGVGPELLKLLGPTQTEADGDSFCWFMGGGRQPGNFVGALTENRSTFLWSAAQRCDADPEQSDDLTIRGGVRGRAVKEELAALVEGRCELMRKIVADTPAESVTKVGLYDRKRLDQKMVCPGGLVALLGDAGHPQTPFLGQGCNMAIADAFSVCTRLGVAGTQHRDSAPGRSVRAALSCLDDPQRKAFAKKTVLDARKIAGASTSTSVVGNFFARKFMQWAPVNFIFPRVDEGNRFFVDKALQDCGLDPLPE